MITDQKEAFALAVGLTMVNVQNLSKPDIQLSFENNTCGELSEFIKKIHTSILIYAEKYQLINSDMYQALQRCQRLAWHCAISTIARISSVAFIPICSILVSASRALFRLDRTFISPFSFNKRRAISPCIAVTMKPALLSPSILTVSIPSITSCGMRAFICCDFLLIELVAIARSLKVSAIHHIQKRNHTKALKCNSLDNIVNTTLFTGNPQRVHKITKPQSASTLLGLLTTTVNNRNEVVMQKHTTSMAGRTIHALNQQKFIWIIAAVRRDCPAVKTIIHHIAAESEHEARRMLAKEHVCFFVGRLPVCPANEGITSLIQIPGLENAK